MKAKTLLLLLIVAALASAGGWLAAKHFGGEHNSASSGARKVLYYQSPMHPWITSDKPGRCTICGMKLEPVYEGERGFAAGEGVVTLGSNTVQAIGVQTEMVTNRSLARTLRVAGMIDDDDTKHRRLSAYADGRIEKLFVNFVGAEVIAGQPLVVLYSPSLLGAESEYLTLAKQKSSPEISETLRAERARLLDAAAQRLKRLGYSDAQLAALAKKDTADARTEILAPMSGTVVARHVYEAQYVKEGQVLLEVADFGTMWFQFDAYERDLNWLRSGLIVEVTTPALPGKVFTTPITFIDPNLNEMTRSARVRVELPNPIFEENGGKRRLLYHKMYAEGAVKLAGSNVLAVPRSAVLSAGEPLVYVEVGDGAYEQRKVKLGRRGDEFVEVLDGVRVGERVVTTGNLLIDSQAQLNATTRSTEGRVPRVPDQTSGATNRQGLAKTVPPPSDVAQEQTAREFLKLTSDLGAALASDDVKKFNDIAPQVHAAIPKLLDSFGNVKALRPALQKLETNGHLEKAEDLAAARKQFLPFSRAAVELVKQLRTSEPFKSAKIFNCPMVNRAIPGAAKDGQWIQLELPLRNPFFGAAMIDCGAEVKP
jgi:Cu(I)/Ag(I) efflux system membrane fusion protein